MATLFDFVFENFRISHAVDSSNEWAKPQFTLHVHNTFEVYYLISGKVSYLIEGVRYELESGSLLLMKPGLIHGYQIHEGEPYERYTLHFEESFLFQEIRDMLKEPFLGSNENPCRHYSGRVSAKIPEIFAIFDRFENTYNLESIIKAKIIAHLLLDEVYCISQKQKSNIPEPTNKTVSDIIKYLNSEFANPISLNMLSDMFYIDKNHINRIFKKATGTTVKEYIIRKRIIHSKQLMSCGLTASEAAEKAGFNDYSAFYRAYINIMGRTPISDRNRN